jgi:Trk K+ transport system NAD-binding subunit
MREILNAANKAANYSHDALRSQAEQINVLVLERIVEKTVSRAIVLAHALDVLKDGGDIQHPMQAFLHAAECPVTGVELDDSEFFACLAIWGRWCETADRANDAVPVEQEVIHPNEALGPFAQRFMRNE